MNENSFVKDKSIKIESFNWRERSDICGNYRWLELTLTKKSNIFSLKKKEIKWVDLKVKYCGANIILDGDSIYNHGDLLYSKKLRNNKIGIDFRYPTNFNEIDGYSGIPEKFDVNWLEFGYLK